MSLVGETCMSGSFLRPHGPRRASSRCRMKRVGGQHRPGLIRAPGQLCALLWCLVVHLARVEEPRCAVSFAARTTEGQVRLSEP